MIKYSYEILNSLLLKNGIHLNKRELKIQLLSHNSYPSLHAITESLEYFNIKNLALRLKPSLVALKELPTCFAAYVFYGNREQLVLVEKEKSGVKISTSSKQTKYLSSNAFLEEWNGVVLAVEKSDLQGSDFLQKNENWLKCGLLFLGFWVCVLYVFLNNGLYVFAHFVLSLFGLLGSIFIVKHELGLSNNITKRFCNATTKTSCEEVLNSKGAMLFGLIKLSDLSLVVFFSFASTCMLSTMMGINSDAIIGLANILAIPFIAYALFYQYRVIQKWCPLCLIIASVLVAQASIAYFAFPIEWTVLSKFKTVSVLFFTGLILFTVWRVLRPLVESNIAIEKIQIEYLTFKRNPSVFDKILSEAPMISPNSTIKGEIILGNKLADFELILITSPQCFFCKEAHAAIEKIIQKYGKRIKIIIRFNIDTNDKESNNFQVASSLIDTYSTKGNEACWQALDKVFGKYANPFVYLDSRKGQTSKLSHAVLEAQRKWSKINDLRFTPALLLNGRLYPNQYSFDDLFYLLEDLIEYHEMENIN